MLTGGRGKAGGIKLATNAHEAEEHAKAILGLDIRGHVVRKLWIEKASDIAKEYYLSLTFDRGAKKPLFMFTTQGGVEIEQVAEENPDALVYLHVDPLEGFHSWQARRLVYGARCHRPVRAEADRGDHREALRGVRHVRRDALRDQPADRDARAARSGRSTRSSPSTTTRSTGIPRSPRCATAMPPTRSRRSPARSTSPTSSSTARSGCSGTAPGLTMSTVDVVTFAGGRPANFCDLGGGGDAQGVVDALSVITRDPQVKAIFFNIFGGITRCDEVARGILQALGT